MPETKTIPAASPKLSGVMEKSLKAKGKKSDRGTVAKALSESKGRSHWAATRTKITKSEKKNAARTCA